MWRREGICIVGVSNCTCINKQKAWCAFGVECGMWNVYTHDCPLFEAHVVIA